MAEPNPNPNPAPPAPDKKTEPNPNPASPEPDKKTEPTPAPPAKSYSQEDIDAAVAAARAEWDKEAKLKELPEDEQAKEKFKQDREQLDKERAELDKRILMQDAKDMLAEKGIPSSFAKHVIGADAKETKENVEAFAEEFNKAVNTTVDDKIKGGNPPKVPGTEDSEDPFLNGLGL